MATAAIPPAESRRNLDNAIQRQLKIRASRDQAAAKLSEQLKKLAKQKEALAAAERKAEAEDISSRQADLAVRRAQAEILPERVTLEIATENANTMLAAFDAYRQIDNPQPPVDPRFAGMESHVKQVSESYPEDRANAFWEAVDGIRDRLLTSDVDDDAALIVLAIEGVIHATERWEAVRFGPGPGGDLSNNNRETMGDCPAGNRRVEAAENELRAVLAGESPTQKESAGQLIASGVGFEQVCRMIGLVHPGGFAAIAELGSICDCGDHSQPSYEFVRWLGCLSLERAWGRRQGSVASRRSAGRDRHIASAHGAVRPGRSSGRAVTTDDTYDRDLGDFIEHQLATGGPLAQLEAQRLAD